MSEGAQATASSLEVSPTTTTTTITTTLECRDETESEPSLSSSPPSPPTKIKATNNGRKYRKHATAGRAFHTFNGKKIRSALTHKKWPPRGRSVSFPTNDEELVTGYLEPANPWEHAENVNIEDLISSYKASCARHGAEPLENLVAQLEKLDISDHERCPELSLKHECLDQSHSEPIEEVLRRVQFEKIDVESASLDDESATILFDMLEYYQSAKHLDMSSNRNIGSRGWQSCAQMIKKTTCLEQFEARDITLTQQHMNILKRPLQLASHLHVLKVENCGLAGRAFVLLVAALKMNTGLKELYLADNCLEQEDAIQLGALLRINNHLQLLDISNNHIKDEGVRDLLDGLIAQSADNRGGKGLSILVLWNNDLTRTSSPYFSDAIAQSITLETLNIGKNSLSNELLEQAQEALIKTRTLLQLGMQSTNLTCKGALLLADILEKNRTLQRIDLRDNNILMEGLTALSFALKRNTSITQLDFDPTPWSQKPATMSQYLDLLAEIRGYCSRNEDATSTDDSTEESGSPQHRSRLSSVSSRKISLTCQTLPRSPPSIAPNPMNEITRTMLEPKRSSGGRLRSPAPSPIPSPVASPIPSPSRGRFVVSRVCETSLSSTNSSASSSPITPPSLGTSPTSFFPQTQNASSSSRFRVTIVETPSDRSSIVQKPLITSANANVTIGFNYKIVKPDDTNVDDDNDSVFEDETNDSKSIDLEEKKIDGISERKDDASNELIDENRESKTNELKVPVKMEDNQKDYSKEESLITRDESSNVIIANNDEPSKESRRVTTSNLEYIETKVNSPKKIEPRQATSLERLLGLFQHPGSLFTGSSYTDKTEMKNPLQEGVNSMIALGDKFQQYLRDGRGSKCENDDPPIHGHLQRSVSDAAKTSVKIDPVKSLSVPQLSNIPSTCTRDFVVSRNETTIFESRKIVADETRNEESTNIIEASLIDDLRLPDNYDSTKNEIIEEEEVASNPIVISTNSRDPENNSTSSVDKSNQTKLKDIPEYSILEISDRSRDELSLENNETRAKCDSSTTDSINDHSFKESSHFNVKCDMSGPDNVHTTSGKDDVHNFFSSPLMSINDDSRISRDSDDEYESNCDRVDFTFTSEELDETGKSEDRSIDDLNFEAKTIVATINHDKNFDNNIDTIVDAAKQSLSILQNRADDLEEEKFEICSNDTIEEFLPIDLPSSSIESKIFAEFVTNDDSQLYSTVRSNEEKNNSIMIDNVDEKMDIFKDAITISELSVRISNSTREISIGEGTIDDEIQHSIEISTSLSEDSDYSSKISVDDVRNGEYSINGSAPNSPSRETMENSIDEQTIVEKNIHDSVLTGSLFGRKAVESVSMNSRELDVESTEDLIFKITDITSIDSITIEDEMIGSSVTTIRISEDDSTESYFDAAQTGSSSGNLFIDTSRNVHRNSQDSGIEETTISITDENLEVNNCQQQEHFQESLDSGIDSECSSVCARVDVGADVQKERARDPGKSTNSMTKHSTAIKVDGDDILGTKITEYDLTSGKMRINDGNIFRVDVSNVGTTIKSVLTDTTSPE